MDIRTLQEVLNANGFPCGPADGVVGQKTRAATARFQQAYNGPAGWLDVDGVIGPHTHRALADLPRLSAHFTVAELACHHCGQAYVRRELLAALEKLRDIIGPVTVIDAYRCPEHNAEVGGAGQSQHPNGTAADTGGAITVGTTQALRVFSGIGDKGGIVRHVDVRHLFAATNPTPKATPANPARWHY